MITDTTALFKLANEMGRTPCVEVTPRKLIDWTDRVRAAASPEPLPTTPPTNVSNATDPFLYTSPESVKKTSEPMQDDTPVQSADEAFCDGHFVWLNHHPNCVRYTPQPVTPDQFPGWVGCPNCVTPWKCNGPHAAQPVVTRENEQSVMLALAEFIARTSPPDDPRFVVADAIARHLGLGWPSAAQPGQGEAVVEIKPVVVEGEPDAQQVWIRNGGQTFNVGNYLDNMADAEWFAKQLRTAIAPPPARSSDEAGALHVRLQVLADEWDRDNNEHLSVYGQHHPASLGCMAEQLRAAINATMQQSRGTVEDGA